MGNALSPSERSTTRWLNERVNPHRMVGNKDKTQLVGSDQLLLVTCVSICPDAHLDEIATFIFDEGGGLCSRESISKRLKEMQCTRVVASTEACQACSPENVLKAELFFAAPPPLGVLGVPRRRLIDADEFGTELNRRGHG